MADKETLAAAEFSDLLRKWLRAQPAPAHVIAVGMTYELAAVVALNAPSVEAACELVDSWAVQMKEQIRTLGVGIEHP